MTEISHLPSRTRQATGRTAIGVTLAALASVAANSVVAAIADSALPAGGVHFGLALREYAPLTIAGILLGTLVWYLVRRTAGNPRAVLRVLVPVAVVVSFAPDLGILGAGATFANSLALMAMHLVVAAITVPTLARVLPLRSAATS